MRGFSISSCSSSSSSSLVFSFSPSPWLGVIGRTTINFPNPNFFFFFKYKSKTFHQKFFTSKSTSLLHSSDSNQQQQELDKDQDDEDDKDDEDDNDDYESLSRSVDGVEVEIDKLGRNSRRIVSRITIDATLDTIWNILTDYEGLSDFIPSLSVSQLLEKGQNYARLFQVGQQDLAFGLNFNAKGVVDCYERDVESFPSGRRRDIEFNMVEGDFQLFQGKWSIEETYTERPEDMESCDGGQVYQTTTTTLSYVVDVKPKLWLPVGLVQGRLCKEVKMNLVCIREEAQRRTEKQS